MSGEIEEYSPSDFAQGRQERKCPTRTPRGPGSLAPTKANQEARVKKHGVKTPGGALPPKTGNGVVWVECGGLMANYKWVADKVWD